MKRIANMTAEELDAITREELVTMLWRYIGNPPAKQELTGYTDIDKIHNYTLDAMTWAVENGIISGYDGKLDPLGNATREQVAQFFMNYVTKTNIPSANG